jgi:hypothetical protein
VRGAIYKNSKHRENFEIFAEYLKYLPQTIIQWHQNQ